MWTNTGTQLLVSQLFVAERNRALYCTPTSAISDGWTPGVPKNPFTLQNVYLSVYKWYRNHWIIWQTTKSMRLIHGQGTKVLFVTTLPQSIKQLCVALYFLLDDWGGNDWLLQIICTYILHLGPLVWDQSRWLAVDSCHKTQGLLPSLCHYKRI